MGILLSIYRNSFTTKLYLVLVNCFIINIYWIIVFIIII